MPGKKPKAIGVHVAAGGFTVGVKAAGFDILCHLENEGLTGRKNDAEGRKWGIRTARLNWPQMPIHVGDWPLCDLVREKVDFLYSNPPCTPWSVSSSSRYTGENDWKIDPRVVYWHKSFDAFIELKPRVFAIESVCLIYKKGQEIIRCYTEVARSLGYTIKHVFVDAKWGGIPQSRKRFFFIAHQPSLNLDLTFNFKRPPILGKVLEGVEDPGWIYSPRRHAIFTQCLRLTLPGQYLRRTFHQLYPNSKLSSRGVITGKPGGLWMRLNPNSQSPAFVGDKFVHPTEDRHLGLNEMKALCGYPLSFKLDGPLRLHPMLLAKSVMPPVGKWLGSAVKRAIENPRVMEVPVVTLLDLRTPGVQPVDLTGHYA